MNDVSSSLIKASQVIGVEVTNDANESLGKIEELVLDKFSGEVRYAVLSFGGILGIGDKLFALPWKALDYDPSQQQFVIGIAKATLQEAPGFDKHNWPDFTSKTWQSSVDRFYRLNA